MKISASKTAPSLRELTEVLKKEFSDFYSCELLGPGEDKNIFVQKTKYAIVRISKNENEFTIVEEIAKPTVTNFFSFTLDVILTGGMVFTLLHLPFHYQKKALKLQMAVFLKLNYA